MAEHLDVLVVGAGISGIGAGYYLQARCPDRSFAILEARHTIGGTWDLFRYPGIRSDSDMHTLGYSFRPWTEEKSIADGPSILTYLHDTVAEYDLERHIRFHHKVIRARWTSSDARWLVDVEHTDTKETSQLSCNFLFMCSGYYNYERGHAPEFPGQADFAGRIVHPQQWTDDIGYAGKKVVVIGSGATAVTLVPELAKKAAHVTMLQRSPTYIVSVPAVDPIAKWLRRKLPVETAYKITRWKNVLMQTFLYELSQRAPDRMRKLIKKSQRKLIGEDFDLDTHFTPSYGPWDQRVCLVPDADLFEALNAGTASVVTDHIDRFTATGIQLRSGEHLDADLIVTATGLELLFLAGLDLSVDGKPVKPADTMTYKAMMFSDVPNLALSFGYTNASWTLKSDLTAEYVCRLLNHMGKRGYNTCVPRRDAGVKQAPFLNLSSGYIKRAEQQMPKQGTKAPWRSYQNYLLDVLTIRVSRLADSALEFS